MCKTSAWLGCILTASVFAACTESPTMAPDMGEASLAKGGGKAPAPPPYTWTVANTTVGLSGDVNGDYVAGACGVSGQLYYGASDDATLSVDASAKKCARTLGVVYPGSTGFRRVGMFVNLTQAAAIPSGTSMKRRLILNPGQFNGNDACGRIIFGVGGVNNVGAGSDSVNVVRTGNRWTVSGSSLQGWCEKQNVLVTNDINFIIANE